MPSKLTNILAVRRPSIATVDPPGTAIHRILDGHYYGLTTPPGSVTELVKCSVSLVEDVEMREWLGSNARQCTECYLKKNRILSFLKSRARDLTKWSSEW
jgi:hypothetical protein